jgi:hypothetical protein
MKLKRQLLIITTAVALFSTTTIGLSESDSSITFATHRFEKPAIWPKEFKELNIEPAG